MVNLIFLRKPYRFFHLWWGLISLSRQKNIKIQGWLIKLISGWKSFEIWENDWDNYQSSIFLEHFVAILDQKNRGVHRRFLYMLINILIFRHQKMRSRKKEFYLWSYTLTLFQERLSWVTQFLEYLLTLEVNRESSHLKSGLQFSIKPQSKITHGTGWQEVW